MSAYDTLFRSDADILPTTRVVAIDLDLVEPELRAIVVAWVVTQAERRSRLRAMAAEMAFSVAMVEAGGRLAPGGTA